MSQIKIDRGYIKRITRGRIEYAKRLKKWDRKAYNRIMRDSKESFAQSMRLNMTPSEKRAWEILKSLGFLPQQVVCGYIADFLHPSKLIVEIDGPIHDKQKDYDMRRDSHLRNSGYRIVRFKSNFDKDAMLDSVRLMLSPYTHLQ